MNVCNWLRDILRNYYYWLRPKEIEIPDCVLQLLKVIYPTVDWNKIHFYDELPWFIPTSKVNAVALPGIYDCNQIHIYFSNFNPYICYIPNKELSLVIHEGYHALQYTDIGIFGIGFIRLFTMKYLNCWLMYRYKKNPFEISAYAFAKNFSECCIASRATKICDYTVTPPIFNKATLNQLIINCPHLIKRHSEIK